VEGTGRAVEDELGLVVAFGILGVIGTPTHSLLVRLRSALDAPHALTLIVLAWPSIDERRRGS
jgi:hypothetical protein